jgi:hypothetical protein
MKQLSLWWTFALACNALAVILVAPLLVLDVYDRDWLWSMLDLLVIALCARNVMTIYREKAV